MKKQPKAVYIIENGGYTELTYDEFRRREQICPLYADKLFLPLYGRLMEVSKEDYAEFYRAKRRQKYLDERSADNGDFSYEMSRRREVPYCTLSKRGAAWLRPSSLCPLSVFLIAPAPRLRP